MVGGEVERGPQGLEDRSASRYIPPLLVEDLINISLRVRVQRLTRIKDSFRIATRNALATSSQETASVVRVRAFGIPGSSKFTFEFIHYTSLRTLPSATTRLSCLSGTGTLRFPQSSFLPSLYVCSRLSSPMALSRFHPGRFSFSPRTVAFVASRLQNRIDTSDRL